MLQQWDSRNANLIININGALLPRDEAGVSPFDSLVQGGDGVWEGLRLYAGGIFKLDAHLDRLIASARAMAFADIPSKEALRLQIRRTLEANSMTDGVHIRLTLSRGTKITSGMDPRLNQAGSTLIVLAEHKPPVYGEQGLRLMTSSIRRFRPDMMDPRIHHNNLIQSILAKVEANGAGADDAMMLDDRGFIAETNATHLFFVQEGRVSTSRLVACPAGITRSVVLQLCEENGIPVAERDVSQAEAYASEECFCTGTMGELVSVTEIDGRRIGTDAGGPVTARLQALFREAVDQECEPI